MKLDKLIPPVDLFSKFMYSAIENKYVFCPQLNSISQHIHTYYFNAISICCNQKLDLDRTSSNRDGCIKKQADLVFSDLNINMPLITQHFDRIRS